MSQFERTPISDCTEEQLRDFCELQQLDVDGARSKAALLAILGPVWDHDYIMTVGTPVMDEEEAAAFAEQTQAPVVTGQRLVGGVGANDPKVKIKVGNSPYPGGNQPVPIGVNGKTIVIQRNMEVDLPYRFYLALVNAVREEVTQDERTGDRDVTQTTAYPFNVLEMPDKAEIAAWHARTKDELMPA